MTSIIFNSIVLRNAVRVCLLYLFIMTIHYVSIHLYMYLCTPKTIRGFMMTPFIVPAPHCQSLIWVIQYTNGHIVNMWILLGTFLLYHIDNYMKPTEKK